MLNNTQNHFNLQENELCPINNAKDNLFSISVHIHHAWSHLFISHKIHNCKWIHISTAFNSIHLSMMIAERDSFRFCKADGVSAADPCCCLFSNCIVMFFLPLSAEVAKNPSCWLLCSRILWVCLHYPLTQHHICNNKTWSIYKKWNKKKCDKLKLKVPVLTSLQFLHSLTLKNSTILICKIEMFKIAIVSYSKYQCINTPTVIIFTKKTVQRFTAKIFHNTSFCECAVCLSIHLSFFHLFSTLLWPLSPLNLRSSVQPKRLCSSPIRSKCALQRRSL